MNSLVNILMANNESSPVVGNGGTLLHYTDRTAFEVLEVRKNGEVRIQLYDAKRVDTGMSDDQTYTYETLLGYDIILKKYRGKWCMKREFVEIEPEHYSAFERAEKDLGYKPAYKKYIEPLFDEHRDLKLIPGQTFVKKEYNPVSVIFGTKQAYYDYSF